MTELLDHSTFEEPIEDPQPVDWAVQEARRVRRFPPSEHTWELVQRVVTIVTVSLCAWYTFSQLHPNLIFRNTTPAGGDMGAHVWAPAYLRDHILPHWRLSGWAPDWYAGFPMYQFYMVIPALLVVGLNVLLPYGVALKLVSVLGIVSLPVTAWAFGKLAGLKFPFPPLLAMAAVVFLFDESFTIYGGNIASTMAGEYSFSIALSLAVLFFGLFAYGLRTGKRSAWAAAVAALAALSHGIVLFFVIIGALVLLASWASAERVAVIGGALIGAAALGAVLHSSTGYAVGGGVIGLSILWAARDRLRYALPVGVVAFLLSAFWLLPFKLRQGFGTDMFYERRPVGNAPNGGGKIADSYWQMFFPQALWVDRLIFVLMVVGIVGIVVRRSRPGLFVALMCLTYWAWAWVWPQSLLWNARLLPFMYLCRYMLVAFGVGELLWAAGRLIRPYDRDVARAASSVGVVTALVTTVLIVAVHLQNLPFGREHVAKVKGTDTWVYDWGPFRMKTSQRGFVDGWAKWNYSGYEAKPAYGEYQGVVSTMASIGQDPQRGCGRALWENNNEEDKYGTPMALMLLPFWTDGCIGSMEGVFFEASGTTPYHFLTTSAMSKHSSNPVRRLKYEDGDVAKGIGYMQALGVRYYLAYSPEMVVKAAAEPALTEIATSGPWHVYQVADSDLVVPLATQPVVAKIDWANRDKWEEVGTSWFQDPEAWAGMPVADGPSQWQRVDVQVTSDKPTDNTNLATVGPVGEVKTVDLPTITVSNTATGDDFVSFDVDKVGVPVLVKMSYFPNWKVSGASGPYRVAPNLMVVVPTSTHVRLHYGYTGIDLGSYLLTFLGLIGLVGLAWRGRVEFGRRWTPQRTAVDLGPEFGPVYAGGSGEASADVAVASGLAGGADGVHRPPGDHDFVREPIRFPGPDTAPVDPILRGNAWAYDEGTLKNGAEGTLKNGAEGTLKNGAEAVDTNGDHAHPVHDLYPPTYTDAATMVGPGERGDPFALPPPMPPPDPGAVQNPPNE